MGHSIALGQAPLTLAGPEMLTAQLAGQADQGSSHSVPGDEQVISCGEVGDWATDQFFGKSAQAYSHGGWTGF